MAVTPARLVVGTQLANAAATVYTVPAGTKTRIDAMALTNTTGGAITVTIYLLASGGTADDAHTVLSAKSIPAGATYIVPGAIGQWLEAGGFIQAFASAATSVSLVCSGIEFS